MRLLFHLTICSLLLHPALFSQQPDKEPGGEKLVVYDLKDLVLTAPDESNPNTANEQPEQPSLIRLSLEEWAKAVRQFASPPVENSKAVQIAGDGHLVVMATQAQHAWIEAFFERQRQNPSYFEFRAYLIQGSGSMLDNLEIGSEGPSQIDFVHEKAREGFLTQLQQQVQSSPGLDLLLLPHILCQQGMTVQLSSSDEMQYIMDWTTHKVLPQNEWVAVPKIQTIQKGLLLETRLFDLDNKRMALDLSVKFTNILDPILTETVTLTPASLGKREIARPVTHSVDFSGSWTMQPAQVFAFRSGTANEDLQAALLIEIKRVEFDAD